MLDMSAGERLVFFAGQLDPLTCVAILEAPASLTGITADQREAILTTAIESAHPGQLAKLEHDSEAIQLLEVASRCSPKSPARLRSFPTRKPLTNSSIAPFQTSGILKPMRKDRRRLSRRKPTSHRKETQPMSNPKIETIESAAKKLTANMQPVADFNAAANVKQPEPPAKKPLPPALAKAFGQS